MESAAKDYFLESTSTIVFGSSLEILSERGLSPTHLYQLLQVAKHQNEKYD